MNLSTLCLLRCPLCGNDELHLADSAMYDSERVREGRLDCHLCGTWYRVENGIAVLVDYGLQDRDRLEAFAERHQLELTPKDGPRQANLPDAADSADKWKQIRFFAEGSAAYERQVAESPYYKAYEKAVYEPWVQQAVSPQQHVLDLGCGTGRGIVPLAQHGAHVVGMDITEDVLLVAQAKAERLGLTGIVDLIVGDAARIPFRDASLDACAATGTLHHVSRPDEVIADISRVLKPGARFYSSDPHASPVRPIFELAMRVWKLHDEEASDNPLIRGEDLLGWLSRAGMTGTIRYSTFVLPHFFYVGTPAMNLALLKITDGTFGSIPWVRRFGGIVVATGLKAPEGSE